MCWCITYLRNTSASRKYFRSKFAYNNIITNTVSQMLRDRQDDSLSESTHNIILSYLIFIVPHFFFVVYGRDDDDTTHRCYLYTEEVVLQLLRLLTLKNWLFSRYFCTYAHERNVPYHPYLYCNSQMLVLPRPARHNEHHR